MPAFAPRHHTPWYDRPLQAVDNVLRDLESTTKAIATHPKTDAHIAMDLLGMTLGAAMTADGGLTFGAGVVADATGAGAIVGVPLNVLGAAEVIAGVTLAGFAAHDLSSEIDTLYSKGADKGPRELYPQEEATLGRLKDMPEFSDRTFTVSQDTDWEYDDNLGNHYDQMGNPQGSPRMKLSEFTDSIQDHLTKQRIYTVMDLNGFTHEQIASIRAYVDALPEADQLRIIRIGF
jgi:hypothetical protein